MVGIHLVNVAAVGDEDDRFVSHYHAPIVAACATAAA
jgi:hypothetical protein